MGLGVTERVVANLEVKLLWASMLMGPTQAGFWGRARGGDPWAPPASPCNAEAGLLRQVF